MKPYKSAIPDYDRKLRYFENKYLLGDLLAKRSALTSGDLEKYELLTGDHNILPTQAHQNISKKLFTFIPLSQGLTQQTDVLKSALMGPQSTTASTQPKFMQQQPPPAPPAPPAQQQTSAQPDVRKKTTEVKEDEETEKETEEETEEDKDLKYEYSNSLSKLNTLYYPSFSADPEKDKYDLEAIERERENYHDIDQTLLFYVTPKNHKVRYTPLYFRNFINTKPYGRQIMLKLLKRGVKGYSSANPNDYDGGKQWVPMDRTEAAEENKKALDILETIDKHLINIENRHKEWGEKYKPSGDKNRDGFNLEDAVFSPPEDDDNEDMIDNKRQQKEYSKLDKSLIMYATPEDHEARYTASTFVNFINETPRKRKEMLDMIEEGISGYFAAKSRDYRGSKVPVPRDIKLALLANKRALEILDTIDMHLSSIENRKERKSRGYSEFTGRGMTKYYKLTKLPVLLGHKVAGNNNKALDKEIDKITKDLYKNKIITKTVHDKILNK